MTAHIQVGKYTGTKLLEGEFGIYRCDDGRWYFPPEATIQLGGEMWNSFLKARQDLIEERGLPDFFLVPGRGAYSWFYAFYEHMTQYANHNRLKIPQFIPFISGLYGQGEEASEEVRILGLEGYGGTFKNGDWLVDLDDVGDSIKSFKGLDSWFSDRGLEVNLDLLVAITKVPQDWKSRGLEERVISPRYQIKDENNPKNSWDVFDTEVSDPFAPESLSVVRNKSIKIRYKDVTLYDIFFSPDIEYMVNTLRSSPVKTPTVRLLASFLMYRFARLLNGAPFDGVISEYPDKDFNEPQVDVQTIAPAVPACDAARAEPRFDEALKVEAGKQDRYVGFNPSEEPTRKDDEKPTPKADVPFYTWTKGIGSERKLQGGTIKEGSTVLLVANYLDTKAEEIANLTGAKVCTASLFPGRVPATITMFPRV